MKGARCRLCNGTDDGGKEAEKTYRKYADILSVGRRLSAGKKYCYEDDEILIFVVGNKKFVFDKKIINGKNLIFAGFQGEAWNDITSSSGIPDYMGTLIGITSVTSIVKYGISQLLKAGLSDSIIKKMTGASEKIIQGCLLQEDNELKQIINAKILMADWYYEF